MKPPKISKLLSFRRVVVLTFLLLFVSPLYSPVQTHASPSSPSAATIVDQNAILDFPNTATFSAHIALDRPIKRVTLEYGVHGLECAEVTAKAFPHITDAKAQDVSWTWDMHKSGPLPTGADIWYRWRVTDQEGAESVSSDYTVSWLDHVHTWQGISQGNITLHWYEGSAQFAQALLSSAVSSMSTLGQSTGVTGNFPANLYIYASASDLKDALLYEPGWIGGVAFPEYNIVLIGISTAQLDWGKHAEAHELTHLLVGQYTFSCTSVVPTWLNEGIAVYGQGGPETDEQDIFDSAVAADKLLPVRALNGGFSAEPSKADLSYSESYSLVAYLIKTYGKDKMSALFDELRNGSSTDSALQTVYKFGLQTFEDQWRASLNLSPSISSSEELTPSPQPTAVPTYEPISAASLAGAAATSVAAQQTETSMRGTATATVTSISKPDALSSPTSNKEPTTGPQADSNPAVMAGISAGILVLLITGVIYMVMRRRSS
jgi:hypothetical protein